MIELKQSTKGYTMQIDATDVINRLSAELTNEIQKRVIAEAQAEAAMKELEELKENDGS